MNKQTQDLCNALEELKKKAKGEKKLSLFDIARIFLKHCEYDIKSVKFSGEKRIKYGKEIF